MAQRNNVPKRATTSSVSRRAPSRSTLPDSPVPKRATTSVGRAASSKKTFPPPVRGENRAASQKIDKRADFRRPKRNEIDNGATWTLKISSSLNIPRHWLVPRAALERALSERKARRSFSVDDLEGSPLSISGSTGSALSEEEDAEAYQIGDDPDAWVPVTDALRGGDLDVSEFYGVLLDIAELSRVRNFPARDAVLFYLARPLPGDPGYESPESMEPDLSDIVDDERYKALNEVWQADGIALTLRDDTMIRAQFEMWRASAMSNVLREREELDSLHKRQAALLAVKPYESTEFVEEESTVHIPFQCEDAALVDGLDLFARISMSRDVPFAKWIGPTSSIPYLTQGPRGGPMIPSQLISAALPRGEGPEILSERPSKVWAHLVEQSLDHFNAAIQLSDFNIIEEEESLRGGAALLISVFAGRDARAGEDNSQYAVKERFVSAVLKSNPANPSANLSGTLSLRASKSSIGDVVERISRALGASVRFDVSSARRTRLTGSLALRGAGEPDELTLIMLTTLDPMFRAYFYIEESSYLQSDKRRMTLQFRSSRGSASEDDSSGRSSLSATFLRNKSGTDLEVRISRARLESTVGMFVTIFSRFMKLVEERSERTRAAISEMLGVRKLDIGRVISAPDTENRIEPTAHRTTESAALAAQRRVAQLDFAPERRIQHLKEAAPDIFVRGYARKCQKYKPRVIDASEIAAWEARGSQVMTYPPPDWKYQREGGPVYLVCDHAEMPFPGVTESDLSNSENYPYYPGCYKTDQMNPKSKSDYNKWYHGVERVSRVARGHVIVTDKQLGVGRLGGLSPSAATLLALRAGDENITFVRYGLEEDPLNSLVHAVLVATRDEEYLALRTSEERIAHAAARRSRWISRHCAELLAQERTGLASLMPTDGERLDTSTCYRLVEEEYSVNLFVIENNTRLQIPRHTQLHARPARLNRPTILLANSSRAPHAYEVVVALRPPKNDRAWWESSENFPRGGALLGEELTRRIHEAYAMALYTTSWTIADDAAPPAAGAHAESSFALENLFGEDYQIVAQVIDKTGHCRAVVGADGSFYEFAPAQPLDLPALSAHLLPGERDTEARASGRKRESQHASRKSASAVPKDKIPTEVLRPWSLERVMRKHGDSPSALDVASGALVGLWYDLAPALGRPSSAATLIYAPVAPVAPVPDFLAGVKARAPSALRTAFALDDAGEENYKSIKIMNRALFVVAQWLTWMWVRSRERGVAEPPSKFVKRLASVEYEGVPDSDYYEIPKMRAFPYTSLFSEPSEDDILRIASLGFPTLVARGKRGYVLRVPRAEFAEKIGKYLDRVAKSNSEIALSARAYVRGIVDEDYLRSAGSLLFVAKRNFLHWFAQQHRHYNTIATNRLEEIPAAYMPQIHLAARSLTPGIVINSTMPITLQIGEMPQELFGRVVLIQNVILGDIRRAFAVALAWQSSGRNQGFRTAPIERESDTALPAYTLLELLPDGILNSVETNASEGESVCWLLRVRQRDTYWYAAVLPLEA